MKKLCLITLVCTTILSHAQSYSEISKTLQSMFLDSGRNWDYLFKNAGKPLSIEQGYKAVNFLSNNNKVEFFTNAALEFKGNAGELAKDEFLRTHLPPSVIIAIIGLGTGTIISSNMFYNWICGKKTSAAKFILKFTLLCAGIGSCGLALLHAVSHGYAVEIIAQAQKEGLKLL